MPNCFTIIFLCLCVSCFSQQRDSTQIRDSIQAKEIGKKAIYSKARRAAILSSCLPGLGQAYNKKYWKIPIIYTGLGGFGYLYYVNNLHYNEYRNALLLSQETSNGGYATVNGIKWGTTELQSQKIQYKKRRDLGVIGVGIIYVLNIIDANVDGHLTTFDVSDDLSLQINPWQDMGSYYIEYNKIAYGISLKLNFK